MSIRSKKPFNWDNHIRAQDCIAQVALTNSKRIECFIKGISPTHLVKGEGCHVTDTAGKSYIDFTCALGTSILGYADQEITEAIYEQARAGALLPLGTPLELDVCEKIKEMFPFVDQVKLLKTGSEACSAAVRIARAFTGRSYILTEGYHGHHAEFVSLTPPALGVVGNYPMYDLSSVPVENDAVAAVIIEPIETDISETRLDWLRDLRKKCTERGTLLIFDEIITGFRFPKFSVSEFYGITPDLICLGKAIGNGMPLAVVGGKKHIMSCGEYFVSSTFSGETLSLASALKTMTLLQTKYDLEFLWKKGMSFLNCFNEMWPEKLRIQGYPTRGVFVGDLLTKALFWQESVKAGILFGSSFFFNFKHVEHSDSVLSTCQDIVTRLKTGSVKLEGDLPKTPFSQSVRGSK